MFATDRDLLVIEPGLMRDVAWIGQRLVRGTGSVSGTSLVLSERDNGLASQGVGAGHVARIGGNGFEIVGVSGEDTAEVSRLRASAGDAAIGLTAMSDVEVEVYTFAPQIADVHRRVLRMLGLSPAGEAGEGEADESAVVNSADLVRLEALGALHLIYAGASAGQGKESAAGLRAELYRARFAAERGAVVARLDLDGDGLADVARRPGVGRFVRV